MKKIISIIAGVTLLCGCASTRYTSDRIDSESIKTLHFTSDDHFYLMFIHNEHCIGIVHDPDCWCMIECD